MKIEGISEEDLKREVEFIMQLGEPMKVYLLDKIFKNFTDHSVRCRVLFNFMANFVCNTINHMSEPDHAKSNVMEIVKNITDWVNNVHEGVIATYDPKTQRIINKEEMH